ncbi:MAG: hypothetical protein ACRDRX_17780 [Pseudonocardiaceae bacterium]
MVDKYSVSWIRTYHTAHFGEDLRRMLAAAEAGRRLKFVDQYVHDFFDIQALRGGHFVRAVLEPFGFSGRVPVRGQDVMGELHGVARCHFLAHSSGFIVLRLTVRSDDLQYSGPSHDAFFAALERAFWVGNTPFRWFVGSGGESVTGGVRIPLNYIFLDLHERWRGHIVTPDQLCRWAKESKAGCERLHELCLEGELHYPFPVSFGTQLEFGLDSGDPAELDQLVQAIAVPRTGHSLRTVFAREATNTRWYLTENQAFTLVSPAAFDGLLDVLDSDRTQLLEFLGLRRAALRSVQRDTQQILSEARGVSRKRVEEWRMLLATTTDDYVLHDRITRLLEPVRLHLATAPSVRDPSILEDQVRNNILSFQSRLDLAGQQVSTLIGALFGVVAAVLTLGSVLKTIAARLWQVEVGRLADMHPITSILVDLGVVAIAYFLTMIYISRVSRRLPPADISSKFSRRGWRRSSGRETVP